MIMTEIDPAEALTAELAEAVERGDTAEARRLRAELFELDLQRQGAEIGAALPPPDPHRIEAVADLFGCVARERTTHE